MPLSLTCIFQRFLSKFVLIYQSRASALGSHDTLTISVCDEIRTTTKITNSNNYPAFLQGPLRFLFDLDKALSAYVERYATAASDKTRTRLK
jgi:hypothetical protein